MDTIGDRLRIARAHRKLTQKALAQKMISDGVNISYQNIQKIESGAVKKSAFLPDIATTLDIRLSWFLKGEGDMTNKTKQVLQNSVDITSQKKAKEIGQQIKAIRQKKGLSLEDLASRVGISKQALQKIESGKTLKSKFLLDIAEALGVSLESLKLGTVEIASMSVGKINEQEPILNILAAQAAYIMSLEKRLTYVESKIK